MKIVIDIEANALQPSKVTQIWCIICKDVDTNEVHIFREVTKDETAKKAFLAFAGGVSPWIGHNFLGYDYPVLNRLLGLSIPDVHLRVYDTLIASKLADYSRANGHSIEAYGEELGYPKLKWTDFTQYSKEMETYCERDVEICLRIYHLLLAHKHWIGPALELEQEFQLICNEMHERGFAFDTPKAEKLLVKVQKELAELDVEIERAFQPKEVLIREFTPKLTKFGTISRTSVPRSLHPQIHLYIAGETYKHTRFVPFNPGSHKQIVEVLWEAGWKPLDKTETHKDVERNIRRAKGQERLDLETKLSVLSKYGWRVNEDNLLTLPSKAPAGARSLAKRILLESRRRTLTEWLGLVESDGRIHGKFYGIGTWTQRMSHQNPNTANIPREFKEDGSKKLLGKELRSLWIAGKNKLLVGVDAEGIQLRIFAHYIDDQEFTDALIRGRKDDKSDPHSLNQRVLGSICKTRQAAKRFIYALLLGGGLGKLSEILGANAEETQEALDRLLQRYTGFARMRKEVFPSDARRGYFFGLDGAHVRIPGETQRDREHLAMSGYLQNGEEKVVKKAACLIRRYLSHEEFNSTDWGFVDIVHDELQSEVINDRRIALQVAEIKAKAIVEAGEFFKLKCPMAGSFYNEDNKDYTIGNNWYQTH